MPALNFAAQFADAVESGAETQTIRAMRKRPFVAGDRLVLYTGQRTTQCRKLLETKCLCVSKIVITEASFRRSAGIRCDGDLLNLCDADLLAHRDGFLDAWELRDWFRKLYGLPFRGQLIKWKHPND